MDWVLIITQLLNGLQLGLLLFLLASGLTLVFGIMDFVNLAHGALYMIGAYFCATLTEFTGSFLWGLLIAVPVTAAVLIKNGCPLALTAKLIVSPTTSVTVGSFAEL